VEESWIRKLKSDTIVLKIAPLYFQAQIEGKKNFEIRKNDRNYKVGSILSLREFDGKKYTGRRIKVRVTFITNYAQVDGYVVLGTTPIGCPHCLKGRPIVDDNVKWMALEGNKLKFNSDKFVGNSETEEVEIAYCPWCGRNLSHF
jgi:hypothetical protein